MQQRGWGGAVLNTTRRGDGGGKNDTIPVSFFVFLSLLFSLWPWFIVSPLVHSPPCGIFLSLSFYLSLTDSFLRRDLSSFLAVHISSSALTPSYLALFSLADVIAALLDRPTERSSRVGRRQASKQTGREINKRSKSRLFSISLELLLLLLQAHLPTDAAEGGGRST